MTALLLMLYRYDVGPIPVYWIGTMLLYAATVLTIWSMVVYLRVAWPVMTSGGVDGSDST